MEDRSHIIFGAISVDFGCLGHAATHSLSIFVGCPSWIIATTAAAAAAGAAAGGGGGDGYGDGERWRWR